MTREDRWIVSLDEIRALRWECASCHVEMSFPLNQTIRLPFTCPSCHADAVDTQFNAGHRTYDEFVQALKAVLRAQPSASAGTLKLEFLAEPARKS